MSAWHERDNLHYYNCTLGIILPPPQRQSYRELISTLVNINPQIEFRNPARAHIALVYLGTIEKIALPKISDEVRSATSRMDHHPISIQEMMVLNRFENPDQPKFLALRARYSSELEDQCQELRSCLAPFSDSEITHDKPHLTVAFISSRASTQRSYQETATQLEQIIEKINWQFRLQQITLLGRNTESQRLVLQFPLSIISDPELADLAEQRYNR